jgi:integrase
VFQQNEAAELSTADEHVLRELTARALDARRLGHKSIEVTHQIYGHLVPSSLDRAYREGQKQQRPRNVAAARNGG